MVDSSSLGNLKHLLIVCGINYEMHTIWWPHEKNSRGGVKWMTWDLSDWSNVQMHPYVHAESWPGYILSLPGSVYRSSSIRPAHSAVYWFWRGEKELWNTVPLERALWYWVGRGGRDLWNNLIGESTLVLLLYWVGRGENYETQFYWRGYFDTGLGLKVPTPTLLR